MQCSYFDAGLCRSCTFLEVPYAEQLAGKQARAEHALASEACGREPAWLEPWANAEKGFRNRAKMVVAGARGEPTLGILDAAGQGIDLQGCPLHEPVIVDALPHVEALIRKSGLIPYDVAAKQGELKHVLTTASPDGELMMRFVLRSTDQLRRLRRGLPALRAALPHLRVVSANIQPVHQAILEGPQEIHLAGDEVLTMRLGRLELALRPQGFFQTCTAAAAELYAQAARWSDAAESDGQIATAWDLYCGVGGFALHLAGPGRSVTGVETSAQAVEGAARAAQRAGLDATFEAADATAWALAQPDVPDLVVVNPPRRGIGAELCAFLDAAAARGTRRVIYSSCNVDSLAGDLARMPAWRAREARVVDMFPHTAHMEVMVNLEPASRV